MTLSFKESSTDDLMHRVLRSLVDHGEATSPTRGSATEVRGVMLELTNPRARLSRSETRGRVFSCLAELCWYLSGTDKLEPIEFYLSHYRENAELDGTIHGAYGPRFLAFDGVDQIRYVIETLKTRPFSRQAVIQIFDHEDVAQRYRHVPCTCLLQFFVRSGRLEAITYMRSNDAYLGLPHDLFAFTMIQEIIARSVGVELGTYTHMVGSMHLYESDLDRAEVFLNEGWQSLIPMPPMPIGDPWQNIGALVASEKFLRNGSEPLHLNLPEEPYWQDLVLLLAAFNLYKRKRTSDIGEMRGKLQNSSYEVFLTDRFGL